MEQTKSSRNICSKAPELIGLNDGTIVIAGVHLTAEEAEEKYGAAFREKFGREDKIDWVSHAWLRFETVGEERADDDLEWNWKVWFLYEQTTRPKGVTRAATVIA